MEGCVGDLEHLRTTRVEATASMSTRRLFQRRKLGLCQSQTPGAGRLQGSVLSWPGCRHASIPGNLQPGPTPSPGPASLRPGCSGAGLAGSGPGRAWPHLHGNPACQRLRLACPGRDRAGGRSGRPNQHLAARLPQRLGTHPVWICAAAGPGIACLHHGERAVKRTPIIAISLLAALALSVADH